jgi:hypothetical protein
MSFYFSGNLPGYKIILFEMIVHWQTQIMMMTMMVVVVTRGPDSGSLACAVHSYCHQAAAAAASSFFVEDVRQSHRSFPESPEAPR